MAEPELSARLQEKLDMLENPSFENNIPFMYVDSSAKVTVGVGHNLTDISTADRKTFFTKRKFMVRRLVRALDHLATAAQGRVKNIPVPKVDRMGQPANEAEIQADFDYLTLLPGLKSISPITSRQNMLIQTTVEMDAAVIREVFVEDLKKFKKQAQEVFADFDSFPVPCQAAIIDLIFNYGKAGFVQHKKALVDAVKSSEQDKWVSAAKLSNRTSANAERNTKVSGWFMGGS